MEWIPSGVLTMCALLSGESAPLLRPCAFCREQDALVMTVHTQPRHATHMKAQGKLFPVFTLPKDHVVAVLYTATSLQWLLLRSAIRYHRCPLDCASDRPRLYQRL